MYELLWLFLIYSFLGWILECIYAACKNKSFINRGVIGGPFCCIYGVSAVLCTLLLPELRNSVFFLFLGSSILYGGCEWFFGKILERIYHKRWWNYENHKYHIDGYVSIFSAALGGILGVVSIKWCNPLFLSLIGKIPTGIGKIVLVVIVILLLLDSCWTYSYILGLPQRFPNTEKIENRVLKVSARMNSWIVKQLKKRLEKAYPNIQKEETEIFAEGCSFYKLFWLFVIGAFLGDITETIFCRITAGVWMSRSSLVWGAFSVVWGLGIAGATWVLYNYREKSDSALFLFGTVLGGAFEYICSVFTEVVFGQVFWDYSEIPFNLGGRINLLYCFFWGIAAVVWLKKLYPHVAKWIEKIPIRLGKWLTAGMVIFLVADVIVSSAALMRYDARSSKEQPQNTFEEWIDEKYDDIKMEKIYPNAKLTE